MNEYPIWDVTKWDQVQDEQLGVKPKAWLSNPGSQTGDPEERWLFKERRPREGAGEDWAEKIAAEVVKLLGLPIAQTELAVRYKGGVPVRGVIARNFVPRGSSLQHGNEALSETMPEYPQSKTGEVPGYTVAAIHGILEKCLAHPDFKSGSGVDAWFQFAGYLCLDALIGNNDRHHVNWALIQPSKEAAYLAPTFDHASSLGHAETADRKATILSESRIGSWLEKGGRTKFEGKPGQVDVAVQALDLLGAPARAEWGKRLEQLDPSSLADCVNAVPATLMSQLDRNFAVEILLTNRRRLLDVI